MDRMIMKMPIGYDIKAYQSFFEEDGSAQWILEYKEFHTEEDYKLAKPDSEKMFKKIGFEVSWDDEEKSVFWKLQGPKYQIVNMLAGEFLGISSLGEMPLKDLLGTLMNALAQSGFKADNL